MFEGEAKSEEQERINTMFRAVLVLAYKDYCSKDPLLVSAVESWLGSADFRSVCDLANADPNVIHKHISTRSKEFESILRLFTDKSKTVNNNRK